MVYFLTGARGMLGSAFRAAIPDAVCLGRESLRIQDHQSISALFDRLEPKVVINCAADVDAEAAELNNTSAIAANVTLPSVLAGQCRRKGALFVHFSSTGCYGDWKPGGAPYTEQDELRPTTKHHATKVSGEHAVKASGAECLILRTGWLFGGGAEHARNFVWKRLCEAARSRQIKSDAHQRGNPTFVNDVAAQALRLVDNDVRGVFNCVSEGYASRLEYVAEIVRLSGLPCRVEATGAFKRLAPVSANETAVNSNLDLLNLNMMPEWRSSLDQYMKSMRAHPEWKSLMPNYSI